jgi:hypothetical protein
MPNVPPKNHPKDTVHDSSSGAHNSVNENGAHASEEATVQVRRDLKKTLKDTPAVKTGALPPPIPQSHLRRKTPKDTPDAYDSVEKLAPIDMYHKEYDRLPEAIRARATWADINKRLLANEGKKLELAKEMQGRGQFFGIDNEGRALFKDRGTHPVMYGYVNGNAGEYLIQIYDRDRNTSQMERVERWADGDEILKLVYEEGYELFKDDGKGSGPNLRAFGLSDEMKQAANANTGRSFIACKSHNLMSWVVSGNNPKSLTLHVAASYKAGGVEIHDRLSSTASDHKIGVVRLLRV